MVDLRVVPGQISSMSQTVSIHPYFKIHAGKMDAAKALLSKLIEVTSTEEGCLWYDFSIGGDVLHCREAYVGAEGLLVHLGNVNALIQEMLTHSDLIRVEVHGPAGELEKLKEPMAPLNPDYFEFCCGIGKP